MLLAKEIIENKEKSLPELPSFGIKDFEPDGSLEQLHQIEDSISAIKNVICHEKVKLLNTLSKAVWRPELHLAEVIQQMGSYWTYMGHKMDEKLYIYPEEALYLLETGSMQIIFNEVPLSVQRAYFVLLGADNGVSLEKYRVYSLLNSNGYKVLRHSPLNSVTDYEKKLEVHKLGIKLKDYSSVKTSGKRQEDSNEDHLKMSKKVKTEANVACQLKNFSAEKLEISCPYDTDTNLDFDYDIYCESNDKLPFRKSCLQLPDFRVVIHRGEDTPPDFKELCGISKKFKDEIPVIHAIVFFDNIAFYKINFATLPDVS